MAWTLLGFDFDLLTLALPLAKVIGGGIGSFFLKRCWRIVVDTKTCTVDKCTGFGNVITKGMCMKCYKKAKSKVESGETTWEELAALGLCEITSPEDPFIKAYNKAKERE